MFVITTKIVVFVFYTLQKNRFCDGLDNVRVGLHPNTFILLRSHRLFKRLGLTHTSIVSHHLHSPSGLLAINFRAMNPINFGSEVFNAQHLRQRI